MRGKQGVALRHSCPVSAVNQPSEPTIGYPGHTVSVETLTFRSLTVVSDNEVDLTFDADDGDTVTFRFAVSETANRLAVTNGPPAFAQEYRQVPGPAIPTWPEQLALAALHARREPLPAGRQLDRLKAEVAEQIERRWNALHDATSD